MLRLLLALLLLPAPAAALDAHYEAYAAGVNVVDMDASFDVKADRYHVRIEYRTVGALGLVVSSRQATTVDGRFDAAGRAVPERFFSSGTLRGSPRVTQIDYRDGKPSVRQLVPPNDGEREDVPPAQQAGTVDTLSAMAELIRKVNATGRCDGQVTTFDGRRLASMAARTSGPQPLDPSGRSSYAGPTLRCEFSGRQLGGFKLDEDRATLARPQQGTAWFAAATPGGPMIPVRIAFRTPWFGEATMYLAKPPG
jgi:hypothetical protein